MCSLRKIECRICKKEKAESEFNPSQIRGRVCRPCWNEYRKSYYHRHPERGKSPAPRTDAAVCKVLIAHGESLKDDPERLKTEFIIGVMKSAKRQ